MKKTPRIFRDKVNSYNIRLHNMIGKKNRTTSITKFAAENKKLPETHERIRVTRPREQQIKEIK